MPKRKRSDAFPPNNKKNDIPKSQRLSIMNISPEKNSSISNEKISTTNNENNDSFDGETQQLIKKFTETQNIQEMIDEVLAEKDKAYDKLFEKYKKLKARREIQREQMLTLYHNTLLERDKTSSKQSEYWEKKYHTLEAKLRQNEVCAREKSKKTAKKLNIALEPLKILHQRLQKAMEELGNYRKQIKKYISQHNKDQFMISTCESMMGAKLQRITNNRIRCTVLNEKPLREMEFELVFTPEKINYFPKLVNMGDNTPYPSWFKEKLIFTQNMLPLFLKNILDKTYNQSKMETKSEGTAVKICGEREEEKGGK